MTPFYLFDQILQIKQNTERFLEFSPPCHGQHWIYISSRYYSHRSFVFPLLPLRSSQPKIYPHFTPVTNRMTLTVRTLSTKHMLLGLPQHVSNTAASTYCLFCGSPWPFPSQLSSRPPTLFPFWHVATPSTYICICICICIYIFQYPCS